MKNLFFFLLSLVWFSGMAQTFPVDTLLKSGPVNNRINVVILGDGFVASEMPKFITEANKFVTTFTNFSPYNRYKNYFNFYAIKTPSNESGITNPGTAPDFNPSTGQPVGNKDTFYGCTFGPNMQRMVYPTKTTFVTSVLANNFPSFNLVVMIANSPYYGGIGDFGISGTKIAVYTLHTTAISIAMHEIGHTFGGVKDEYWMGPLAASEAANLTRVNSPATIKWKNWLGKGGVGIFEHKDNSNVGTGWYKPLDFDCLMYALNKPFCFVCREQMVDKILSLVKPIESSSPSTLGFVRVGTTPKVFNLSLVKPNPNSLQVEWRLNGTLIGNNIDQVTIANNDLPNKSISTQSTLVATVFDSTATTQTESTKAARSYSLGWQLIKLDLPVVTATQTAICLGKSTTLTASGCSSNLTWSTGQTTVSIKVSPTQTTTYTARCMVNGVMSNDVPISITVNPLPAAPTVSPITVISVLQTAKLTATGCGLGVTSWYAVATGGTALATGATFTTYVSATTIYYASCTSKSGCESSRTPAKVTVRGTARVGSDKGEENIDTPIAAFPNPVTDEVTVLMHGLAGQKVDLKLLNILGQQVSAQSHLPTSNLETTTFDMRAMPVGFYFIESVSKNKRLTIKILKTN